MTTEPLIPLDDSNNNEHPIIINDNSYNGDGIKIEILLHYKHIGFRITPLGYDSQTPSVPSTNEIYNNLSYWTDEKIVKDSHLFKNVATLFGKTHLKDADGLPLYVNELDIEDKAVYDMLAMVKTKNKDCFFIDEACQNTFVTKGRKKWGLKMYWLSHKQYPCISIKNCKLGYQFEIKTDNTLGHSTLPPSYHRKDKTIHYQLIGQPKIAIMDGLYDWLLQVLADCIKEKEDDYNSSSNNNIYYHNANLILTDSETEQIAEIFLPIYKEPKRHHISVGLAGLCCKEGGISLQSAAKLSETLSDKTNDKERKSRLTDVQTTYKRWYNKEPIQGASLLAQVLGNDAAHILAKFHQILRNRRTAPIKITRNGSNIKIEIANQTHSIDFNPDPDTMFNQIMGKISTLGVEIDRHSLVAQLALIIDKDFQENSTPAERLLLMVTSRIIDSFRDETDTAFIVIEASGHKKMVNVDIEDFDEWASDMYELEYHEVLTSSTIENTKRVIRARIKNTRILQFFPSFVVHRRA